jgi:type I restriction enzyme M protein
LTEPEDIAATIIGHLEAALEEIEAVSEELDEEEQSSAEVEAAVKQEEVS